MLFRSSGTVERMFLRTTQLRSVSGDLHVIPNGKISGVTNLTRQWSRAVLTVGVSYSANLDDVFEALKEIGKRAEKDESVTPYLKEPFSVVGVTALGDSAVTVRMWAKVEPMQQWAIERSLRKIAKEVFDERNIEIPFPQTTLSVESNFAEILKNKN